MTRTSQRLARESGRAALRYRREGGGFRLRAFLLLGFATVALAADLPRSAGYVSDFAGRLSPSDRQSLENRLRDYERATSNEVAVAIVGTLDGESIDSYANRLFKFWGIGKKDRNNGVLLLWAPVERKVRIEVGLGLEGAISNTTAAGMVRTVTTLFRQKEYVRGLNAGVDAILARLDADGPRYIDPIPPPEAPVESRPNGILWIIPVVAGVVLIALIALSWRRAQQRRLASSLPHDLERCATALGEGERIRKEAVSALDKLRQEAPPAVWEEFTAEVDNAGSELSAFREELAAIRSMAQQETDELVRAHRALERWTAGFAELRNRLDAVGVRLDGLHYCRERAELLLIELRESLERRSQLSGWGSTAKLVQAASNTYSLAVTAAAANPVNWLLVYDLLIDTQECLQCADNPDGFRRSARSRNWMAGDMDSPALALMMEQPGWGSDYSVDTSGGTDSSSFSAGDSGGSTDFGGGDFGGGDSGGGGASSDY